MRLKNLYLTLCILGLVIPYVPFVSWVLEHGLDMGALLAELLSTRIGAFFGLDVIISAVVVLVFISNDARLEPVPGRWVAVVGTIVVGVSFGFPLYLYLREHPFGRKDWGPGLAE